MGIVLQLLFYDSTSLGPCGHRLFGDRVSSIQDIHSRLCSSYKEVFLQHSHLHQWIHTVLLGMIIKGVLL